MTKILVCVCLLSALSFVEVKTLSKVGRVGETVTFKCSDWNAWGDVRQNVKYFCHSPCAEDKHIITKADFKKTKSKDRIEITNNAEGLYVTFTDLKKSDSKIYYCGIQRFGFDKLIKVNLTVIDAEPPVLRTSTKPVTVAPSVSFAVTNSSTVSSPNSITTEEPVFNTTSNVHMNPYELTDRVPGYLSYLIIGFVAILLTLMVLMMLMKRQQKVVSSANSPHQVAHGDDVYEEIDLEEQQTESQPVAASTHHFSAASTGVDPYSVYANAVYLQDMTDKSKASRGTARAKSRGADRSCETVYSFVQQPKKNTERNENSQPTQSVTYDNDCLYSLAELP